MNLTSKLLLLSCLFALPAQSNAQMSNADTRFIPENCFFVLQFDMQKLFSYEKMGAKNLEKLNKFFKKEAKFDLMAMKTLTFLFCETGQEEDFGEEVFGIAMTFSKNVAQEEFLDGMGVDFEESTINGKKIFKAQQQYAPSVCFDDGKTVLISKVETLEKMIGKEAGKAKICALLQSADPDSEVKGAFLTSPMYSNFLAAISRDIPISPFNIEKVFGEAKTAIISGNVKSSTPIYIQVGCKSEEGAQELAKRGKFLVDLGKATIPISRDTLKQERKRLEKEDLSGFEKYQYEQMAAALQGLELSEKILNATETSSTGKTAYVKVKKMGGVKELVPLLAQMFAAQFEALDILREGSDEPREIEDFEAQKDDF